MREIVPGLIDPIQAPELAEKTREWAHEKDNIARHLENLQELVKRTESIPPPADADGDGLVMVGGGKFQEHLVIACRMLRETGSSLPIQIWHRGEHEPLDHRLFDGIGNLKIVDSVAHAERHGPARILRGWEQKLHALVHCGLRRVAYLDADAYFVEDPAPLFASLDKAPFVFWHDLAGNYNTVRWPAVWPEGANGVDAIQGGQLAFDRVRIWRVLALAHWLNQHSDFYYSHMFGDQDTWRVAMAAVNQRDLWHCLGPAPWIRTAFVCGVDPKVPLVVHRCQGKLFRQKDIPVGKSAYGSPQWVLPKEKRVFDLFADLQKDITDSAQTFENIYQKQLWGKGSGPGSTPNAEARPYIDMVNTLIGFGGQRSIIDLGCGDGVVGTHLKAQHYVGVDCTDSNISRLRSAYPSNSWLKADIFTDRESLPSGELALMKDVLHHWPNWMITEWLRWARSSKKWKHILLTQDVAQHAEGADTYLGGYRALNPGMAPLAEFGLQVVMKYLHKAILLMTIPG